LKAPGQTPDGRLLLQTEDAAALTPDLIERRELCDLKLRNETVVDACVNDGGERHLSRSSPKKLAAHAHRSNPVTHYLTVDSHING
jgi:hypothetical protein